MDFAYSDEQKLLRDSIVRFARGELNEGAIERDRDQVDGQDLRGQPLSERRRTLHEHVEPVPGLQLIQQVETHGEALFYAITSQDHEGIVAKRLDAPYRADAIRPG